MSAADRMQGIRQSLAAFWGERNRREQNMLTVAIAVVVLGLVYALFIDPAASGRLDLQKKLPALRQQAAEVQALARQASALGGKAATLASAPALSSEGIGASLARKGLTPQSLTVTGELVRVQWSGASFAGIVDWLDEMQRSMRLSVVEANVETSAQPDTVNATFTLRQQRGEQAQ